MEMTTQDLELLRKMGIAPQETEEERKARYERVRLEMLPYLLADARRLGRNLTAGW
jgi:hypothetical protein